MSDNWGKLFWRRVFPKPLSETFYRFSAHRALSSMRRKCVRVLREFKKDSFQKRSLIIRQVYRNRLWLILFSIRIKSKIPENCASSGIFYFVRRWQHIRGFFRECFLRILFGVPTYFQPIGSLCPYGLKINKRFLRGFGGTLLLKEFPRYVVTCD